MGEVMDGPVWETAAAALPAAVQPDSLPEWERQYWLDRAERQLELSRASPHERAARSHALLAGFYFDRAFSGQADRSA